MKVRGVDFVVYNVSDYKKAVEFYKDVLGLKLTEEYAGFWAEFEAGSVTVALCAPPYATTHGPGGGATVALSVDDVKIAVKELKEKNVKIIYDVSETDVCFQATISDLDGNKIILHQRKDGTVG